MIFGTHCNFFIVLPIRLKTCISNGFFFLKKGKMCTPKKWAGPSGFAPERNTSASGEQFAQNQKFGSTNKNGTVYLKYWMIVIPSITKIDTLLHGMDG